jgi:cytochrome P450
MTVVSGLRPYPFEPFNGDLPAELLDMVESNPISQVLLPDGRPAWMVLSYAHCRAVLSDPCFAREHVGRAKPGADEPRDLSMDGPPHTAVRSVAMRSLSQRRIESYRPLTQRLADELIDDMIAGPQPADLVSALVAPLPVRVICAVLGVGESDRDRLYAWIKELNSITEHGSQSAVEARVQFNRYVTGQLAAKRASPADDLMSSWVAGGHDLTDTELVELAMGLLLGGLEVNSISAGLRALFQHPPQLAKLRAAPEKMLSATEEILRYTTVSGMGKVLIVVADTELGGVAMRAGDYVMAMPAAADRDPRVFPEPNVFDIDRVQTVPHLGFGHGPHSCLGRSVGKLQVEVAIGTLVRRLPGLAPAVAIEEIPWRHDRINCGIESFPVTW